MQAAIIGSANRRAAASAALSRHTHSRDAWGGHAFAFRYTPLTSYLHLLGPTYSCDSKHAARGEGATACYAHTRRAAP